jgi:hypothetical protein
MVDDVEAQRRLARDKQAQLLREHFEAGAAADEQAHRAAMERAKAKAKPPKKKLSKKK